MVTVCKADSKKIIICCDGTWQSSVSGKPSLPSNITRLARTIAKAGRESDDKVWQQIVYYDAGIGTSTTSAIEASVQGATGEGLITDVLEAYNFVVNNYSPGDKIYCFGFSRGATTARAVAGMITDFGVIQPQYMKYFPSLLAAYRKNLDKRTFRKTKEYFEWFYGKRLLVPESQKDEPYKVDWLDVGVEMQEGSIEYENSRQIELVGVFDTVGSLGLGDTYIQSHASSRRQYEWINVGWSPYIKHVFHALALDERRQAFLPTLYYIPNKDAVDKENEAIKGDEVDWPELTAHRRKIDQEVREQRARIEKELAEQKCPRKVDVVQVWFTGVHINVGGGTDDAARDFEGLANITFAWMIEQCRPYLAFEDFTNDTIANYIQRVVAQNSEKSKSASETPNIVQRGTKAIGEYFYGHHTEKMVKPESHFSLPTPRIGIAHWTGYRAQDSYSLMFRAILSPANRAPGASDDRSAETHRLIKTLGEPNEYVHPSVQYRLSTSSKSDEEGYTYKCKPLEDFENTNKYKKQDGVYGWYKKGAKPEDDIWIPEWPILAALEPKKQQETCLNDSEMTLVEQGEDRAEVREFLSKRAAAWKTWKTANPTQ